MKSIENILINALIWLEFTAAFTGLIYFFKYKNSYWKWFAIYLIVIFIQECFWFSRNIALGVTKQQYYAFFGIPIQYIFFYWLYGLKSLKKKKLFIACLIIYISSYIPIKIFYEELNAVYSLNLTIGTIILTLLVVLEFKKQIVSDDILRFSENKMFYINVGVILFYIGTYPFFAFYDIFSTEEFEKIGDIYYLYFRISLCVMYLFFIASYVWGKQPLK